MNKENKLIFFFFLKIIFTRLFKRKKPIFPRFSMNLQDRRKISFKKTGVFCITPKKLNLVQLTWIVVVKRTGSVVL